MTGVQVATTLALSLRSPRSVEVAARDPPGMLHRDTPRARRRPAGRARRLVFAAELKCIRRGVRDDGQREDASVRPLSPYAAAKLAGELYLQAFAASYGWKRLLCGSSTSLGRGSGRQPLLGRDRAIHRRVGRRRVPTIFGDGLQSRDFTMLATPCRR